MDLARNLIGRINVGDSLTRSAATRPGQLAVVDGDRRLTYRDFNAYVNRVAHGLAGLGYERGATLAVASGNSADFLAVYYACAKLGVVCVPVNLGWRPDEVAYVLGHSRTRGIVVETQLVATMRDAIAKVPEVLDVIVAPGTQNSYQAEMSPITTLFRPEHQLSHIGAKGTPLTGVQVAIMDPGGDVLPPGEKNLVRSEHASHYQEG
jgi:acyl-CoA synthetase (AMP-forming)/AMP-acid ligase II